MCFYYRMPSLNRYFLSRLHGDCDKYNVFIETGTLSGETIFAMEPFFLRLHTIELSEKYYNYTRKRYIGNKINFILGDSSKVFEYLLPSINEGAIFFLDGHWSSCDTARGDKDCPLLEEVSRIHNLFAHEAIIIIDDYRLFGTSRNEDWSDISKESILSILQSRVSEVYHLPSELDVNDRLIIHINKL